MAEKLVQQDWGEDDEELTTIQDKINRVQGDENKY